jgi:hypothetical protein
MAPNHLEIAEYNEAGALVASYISSPTKKKELASGDVVERVDVIVRVIRITLLD